MNRRKINLLIEFGKRNGRWAGWSRDFSRHKGLSSHESLENSLAMIFLNSIALEASQLLPDLTFFLNLVPYPMLQSAMIGRTT
jgi:hypothetical protein